MDNTIKKYDWTAVEHEINHFGYTTVKNILTEQQCRELTDLFNQDNYFRKTVVMARHRFGLGTYKYFAYPLPPVLQTLREQFYSKLAPLANTWMNYLKLPVRYPELHCDFITMCHAAGQLKPTPLLLSYPTGGYNTLHQDLYGELFFPFQLVLFLSDPSGYDGGEFVLTEQVPRAQSKAIVLRPQQGDGILFTTSFRPVEGSRGYYKVNMRHGVSPVVRGERHTAGIIFHDART